MVESVYTGDSKSPGLMALRVRVPPLVPIYSKGVICFVVLFFIVGVIVLFLDFTKTVLTERLVEGFFGED